MKQSNGLSLQSTSHPSWSIWEFIAKMGRNRIACHWFPGLGENSSFGTQLVPIHSPRATSKVGAAAALAETRKLNKYLTGVPMMFPFCHFAVETLKTFGESAFRLVNESG
jgi:hypothetical protein